MNFRILDDLVERAESAVTRSSNVQYLLNKGRGYTSLIPGENGVCDDMGFISWVYQIDRDATKLRAWDLTTEAIRANALGIDGLIQLFEVIPNPVPGCLVICSPYDDFESNIAIVTKVVFGGPSRLDILDGVKCSNIHPDGIGPCILTTNLRHMLDHQPIYCLPVYAIKK